MVIISGKEGFRFPSGHFDALMEPNCQEETITTEGILEGVREVDRIFTEEGFYEDLKKSPYFVKG